MALIVSQYKKKSNSFRKGEMCDSCGTAITLIKERNIKKCDTKSISACCIAFPKNTLMSEPLMLHLLFNFYSLPVADESG